MSTGHMYVYCIELLRRGCKGHWGTYGYMYMGCYTHGVGKLYSACAEGCTGIAYTSLI